MWGEGGGRRQWEMRGLKIWVNMEERLDVDLSLALALGHALRSQRVP